jgi:dipeptidyl aminopeptidase/acylaminoacyl peptidase
LASEERRKDMDPLYDLHSWSKHYREEALREARKGHLLQQGRANEQPISNRSTLQLASAVVLMAGIVTLLLIAATAKPAEAAFAGYPEGHGPIAFEDDGDIWVASIMHLENLTPNTSAYLDVDPAVSPDGGYVAFASDRDGHDFEIYTANVFTGEVRRVTGNGVTDYNPAWSPDGRRITYAARHYWMNTYSFTRGTSKAFE